MAGVANAAGRKACMITGAATGIGAACALEFARNGWNVVVAHLADDAQHTSALEVAGACEAVGARVHLQPLDVSSDADCRAAAGAAEAAFGRLDALINCAGVTRFVPHAQLDELNADEFHRVYDVNLIGIHQMVRACRTALGRNGNGSVVNISSIGGIHGLGSSIAYAASKGAVNTLTLSLARVLGPVVRVNAIAPGFVDGGLPSRMLSAEDYSRALRQQVAGTVLKRTLQPEEVASLAWFMCERAPGMTGEIISLDNGFHLNVGN